MANNALVDENIEVEKKQYIVVSIGSEQYGIDISFIDNIVRMAKITRVPGIQGYVKGIINLRGEIVPVMSIRLKMGLEDDVYTNASRIIILKIDQMGALGIIVDSVKEVISLGEAEIDRGTNQKTEKNNFINGIGKNGDELVSLLDLNAVIDESVTQ